MGQSIVAQGPGYEEQERYSRQAMLTLMALIGVGILGLVMYSLPFSEPGRGVQVFSVGLGTAGASIVVGGLLGFLFGIPRTLQQSTSTDTPLSGTVYQANTNLEQISDWLTKILIGVGLTQLLTIPEHLQTLASFLAPGLGDLGSSRIFAVAMVLYFLACGFLLGYLWTRLHLAGALTAADRAMAQMSVRLERTLEVLDNTRQDVTALHDQSRADFDAWSLVNQQLNPSPGVPAPTQAALDRALSAASPPTRAQIFFQAQAIRRASWRDDKPKMALTIPVFRALIASDTERTHRYRGQLGYALKDLAPPNWSDAERTLSEAIELRGAWANTGWLLYEFNRAICRINLDEGYLQDQASSPEVRERILADLRIAASDAELRNTVLTDQAFARWLQLNNVGEQDLAQHP